MNRVRLAVYLVLLFLAYCEENDIPVRPFIWHQLTSFFLKVSNAAWNAGIYSSKKYQKAVSQNG